MYSYVNAEKQKILQSNSAIILIDSDWQVCILLPDQLSVLATQDIPNLDVLDKLRNKQNKRRKKVLHQRCWPWSSAQSIWASWHRPRYKSIKSSWRTALSCWIGSGLMLNNVKDRSKWEIFVYREAMKRSCSTGLNKIEETDRNNTTSILVSQRNLNYSN